MKVVHTLHHPTSAKVFVHPVTEHLRGKGWAVEVWSSIGSDGSSGQLHLPNFNLAFSPLSMLVAIVRFSLALKKHGADAVHAHQTRSATIPLLAAHICNVPVRIYHNHGIPYLGYRGSTRVLLRLLEEVNLSLSTHAFCVSPDNVESVCADRIARAGTMQVLENGSICGCDAELFSKVKTNGCRVRIRSKLKIAEDSCVFLYVGRPHKRKGFDDLLKAWALLETKHNWRLLMAGITEKDVRVRMAVRDPTIVALGHIDDMPSLYCASDVVVLPSHHEGLPYALLEGSFAGAALIGTRVPGIISILRDEVNGLLVEKENPEQLAKTMAKLGADLPLRIRLSSRALAIARTDFSRERLLIAYERAYNKIKQILEHESRRLAV